MTFLTKKDILKAQDLQTEVVDVPEWGGQVKVRGLSGLERDQFEHELFEMVEGPGLRVVRSRLLARCLVGEDDQRLFADGDIDALGKKSAVPLNRLFVIAQKLSGLAQEDVEELAKN